MSLTPAGSDWPRFLKDSLSGRGALEVLDDMALLIREAESFLLSAHLQPDGDSLGSEVALALALRSLGKRVRAVNAQATPERYRSLLPPGVIEVIEEPQALGKLGPVDLCVLLDTSEPERTGGLREVFFAPAQRRICLDHHLCPSPVPFDSHLVVTEAPATGNLVLALLDRLNIPLNREIAQALWIAVATDTGWFRFPNATPWAFLDAARLAAYGIELEDLYDRIYQESSAARARVLGAVLANLRSEFDGRFLWSLLPRAVMEKERVNVVDLDGMVDSLKAVRGVRIVAFIVELGSGEYKVSFRARGEPDVESIARQFGGGGHAKAAGCRFRGSFEDLQSRLFALVRRQLG